MKNNILKCCWIGERFAKHVFTGSNRMQGRVISVFDSAANIKTHDNHLLVITKNAIRSAITLNIGRGRGEVIDSFQHYIKFGSAIWGDKIELLVENGDGGSIVIDLRKSKLFKRSQEPLTETSLTKFRDIHDFIFLSLLKFTRPGCLLQPDIMTEGLLSKQISSIAKIGNKIDNESQFIVLMTTLLSKFCGRGPGYTPAGDDFITGYLSMYNWCAKCLNFNKIELPHYYADSTSWTSYRLMKYGTECVCDEEIQALINSVAHGNENEFVTNIPPISHRGHTSGIDLVTGVICALYTVIDRKFGTSTLREISSLLQRRGR